MNAIVLIFGPVLSVWEAFALKVLWGWFLVPLGLPAIGMAQAFGISLMAGLMTHQAASNSGSDERNVQVLAWALVAPAMALAAGWIAKNLM